MDLPGARTFAYRFISANWVSLLGRPRSSTCRLRDIARRCNETDVARREGDRTGGLAADCASLIRCLS